MSGVANFSNMLDNCGLSTVNYDATLLGWSQLPGLQSGQTLGASGLTYCDDTGLQVLTNTYGWTIDDAGQASGCGADPFITTWETSSANESITITTNSGTYTYDYIIDWGDGTVETNQTGNASHTYATAGDYTVSISGDFPHFYLNYDYSNRGKLLSVDQWGDI